MHSAAGVVVGPHDEVIEATETARNLGLVRATRITAPELLDLVREVRRDRRARSQDLQINRRSRAATTYLVVHVAPLGEDLVVVLADDETTARRVEETRRDFIANTSHELKTPIGAISLLAEAVEDAADDPQAVRRFATRMGIESARLSDLVSQIIELSRLQSDNPLTKPEVVEVDDVLAEAVDRSRVDADRHDVTLTIAGTSGLSGAGQCAPAGRGGRQSRRERRDLLRRGSPRRGGRPRRRPPRRRLRRGHGVRHGDRHPAGRAAQDLRALLPGRLRAEPGQRRHRVSVCPSSPTSPRRTAAQVSVWSQPGRGSTFTLRLPAHLGTGALPGGSQDSETNAGRAGGSTGNGHDHQELIT